MTRRFKFVLGRRADLDEHHGVPRAAGAGQSKAATAADYLRCARNCGTGGGGGRTISAAHQT